jgi:hypothetical protein
MTRRLATGFIVLPLAVFSGCAENNERPEQEPPDCGCDEQPDGGECVDTEQPEPDGGVPGWRMTWAAQAGGDWPDPAEGPLEIVWDLQPTSDSSVLVTGRYSGAAVFGAGEPNETTLPTFMPDGDGDDLNDFVARYGTKGELMWADGFGGVDLDEGGFQIEKVNDDIFEIVAAYAGEMTIGLGQPNETILIPNSFDEQGNHNHALAAYSVEGAFQWAVRASDAAHNLYLLGGTGLPDGSLVVAGWFSLGISLAPDTPEEMVLTTSGTGDRDAVVARFSAVGSLEWARQISGPGQESSFAVERLLGGEILVAGTYQQTVVFGASEENETLLECGGGSADAGTEEDDGSCPFLAVYTEDGALLWAKGAGFSYPDFVRLTAAPDGGFALSSTFVGTGLLGEGEPNETAIGPTSGDDYDVVIARYDADGALLWARQIVGETEDWTEIITNTGYPMAFLDSGELVVAGTYRNGAPVFGQGEPNETTLPDTNAHRIFISMFYPNGNLAWAISPHGGCMMNDAVAVAAYGDSAFFVGGSFGDTVDFGTSSEDRVTMTASGDSDIFVLRFDRTGGF